MKKDKNTCVRLDRDGQQIDRCKQKINEFNPVIASLSKMLSLAGNEVRMNILFLLEEEDKLCVCDLSEILEMKIPAVSQHLRKLKDANMVFAERDGVTIFYQISPKIKLKLDTIFSLLEDEIVV